ncbi:hypothetical protein PTQ21_08035 [Paenibacillus marchantiae]|uniref:hypothetical protein n=1 Tax=Paenibacillus marchantiae TaxID=3026433 RepID=UPI00237BDD2A|nr:hypothetical protein [Paenibacillus marchantiae]WDQ34179.1 hypothetical protein PTQ21_08035 [Paenibacillus marchantiae]
MSEKWNVELHMSPGGWTAEVSAASDASKEVLAAAGKTESAEGLFTVTGTLQQFSEAEREAVLAQLRKRPLALYALLRGGPAPAELAGLLPATPSEAELGTAAGGSLSAGGAATCTCGRTGCAHASAAERAVAARFAAEPLLQLAHAGLPREALLAGVLGSWAEELAHDPSGPGRAAETAGRPQARGGEGGAAVGEWIAEAAADGAMHQPGPGFGAVKVRLAQPGKPPATPELAALLPGVPATAGLALIRERVAARMWEAVQKKKKDSPATK